MAGISGSVIDKNEKKPIHNAVIALLKPGDSILYKFTRSDIQGKYILKEVRPGDYILMTTHPYFADLMCKLLPKRLQTGRMFLNQHIPAG